MTTSRGGALRAESGTRLALALIAAFALAHFVVAATLGEGFDESYTIVIARRLELSYFDHPPLHQWIAHFASLAFGEGVGSRLPFVVLFAATGWLLFALTRRLFDARAGIVALVALNCAPFFFASAGAWVVPDGPLLFALAAAALALAEVLFGDPTPRGVWALWLVVGLCLGLAGLSKYSAALTVVGLLAFLVQSPRQRHWFSHPAPYVAALLAVALVAPVFVWNAQHGWVSFAFQGARGAAGAAWKPVQVIEIVVGQFVYLAPWLFIPLVGALVASAWRGFADERRLFLACLALPPILVFTVTPFWGARGLPHWPMPGWFFVFPLLGAWLGEPWAARFRLQRWGVALVALTGVVAVASVTQVSTGWATRLFPLPRGAADPTLEMLDWRPLREAPLLSAHPAFVVSMRWAEAGKIGLALGPGQPILISSGDPRGMAFLDSSARYLGRDGVVVVPARRLSETLDALQPYFERFDPPQTATLRRDGADEIELALIPAHNLTRAFALPYPR
ncbi:MAG: glycosyltransferase family 39 protein [Hyphomicrobiales bacterium]|nr:glycosyltransferase family 39 protein [Hyphomicrobiales bacterium]MBV8663283.1 glycosyltransferase family 39 protein [Hyphomicrobiales bacterium]